MEYIKLTIEIIMNFSGQITRIHAQIIQIMSTRIVPIEFPMISLELLKFSPNNITLETAQERIIIVIRDIIRTMERFRFVYKLDFSPIHQYFPVYNYRKCFQIA